MKFIINENLFDTSKVTFRQLGFGREVADRKVLLFKLLIRFNQFKQLIQEEFNLFVNEIHDDDLKTNCSDPIDEILQYNYPTFDELEKIDRDTLCMLIKEYLFFELLEACFDENEPKNCLVTINKINSIENINNTVQILGEAYHI